MINERGIWSLDEAKAIHHSFQSKKLADWLANNLDKQRPVIDFGCGIGFYCKVLQDSGFNVFAYEGTPDIEKISVFHPITQCDLSKPVTYPEGMITGNIVCLEVGEHVPAEYEAVVLDNICNFAKTLVMSWATPNQPGIGHVNGRTNDWVIEQMKQRGLSLDEKLTAELRALDFDGLTYFKNTVFVFRRVN